MLEPSASSVGFAVEEWTLSNGLRVVVHRDAGLPLVHVVARYSVGTRDEAHGQREMAHLYEHMLFERTEHLDESVAAYLARAGAALGSGADAGVDPDATVFFTTVPATSLESVLWLAAEQLASPFGDGAAERFEAQLGIVHNEILARTRGNPFGRAGEFIRAALFPPTHPYGERTPGDRADLSHVTLAGLREFGASWYTPANCVLVVAGDVDVDDVRRLVERHFGDVPPSSRPLQRWRECPSPLTGPAMLTVRAQLPVEGVNVAWPTVPWRSSEEAAFLTTAALVGGGPGSRLVRKLVVEDELAVEVSASQASMELAGFTVVTVGVKAGSSPEAVVAVIDEELRLLARDGPAPDELATVLGRLEFGAWKRLERVGGGLGRAHQLANSVAALGDATSVTAGALALRGVTAADVARAAGRLVESPRLLLAYRQLLGPRNPAPSKAVARPTAPPKPRQTEVLATDVPRETVVGNGLRLVVLRRSPSPMVHLQLLVRGGASSDPPGKEGLASLSGAVLAERLAPVGALGAAVHAEACHHVSGASVDVLAPSWPAALSALVAAVARPVVTEAEGKGVRECARNGFLGYECHPASLAELLAPSLVYGPGHPYGRPVCGTRASVGSLSPDDLGAFATQRWHRDNGIVLVVGDVELERVADAVMTVGASWSPKPSADAAPVPAAAAPAVPAARTAPTGYHVPGLPQTVLLVAGRMPGLSSPGRASCVLAHHLLLGSATSRANMRLREELGFTYGVRSSCVRLRDGGYWMASCAVDRAVTGSALRELLGVFDGLREAPFSDTEVSLARRSVHQAGVTRFESTTSQGETLQALVDLDLAVDRWLALVDPGAGADASSVRAAAEQWFSRERMVVAALGDLDVVGQDLEAPGLGAFARSTVTL